MLVTQVEVAAAMVLTAKDINEILQRLPQTRTKAQVVHAEFSGMTFDGHFVYWCTIDDDAAEETVRKSIHVQYKRGAMSNGFLLYACF